MLRFLVLVIIFTIKIDLIVARSVSLSEKSIYRLPNNYRDLKYTINFNKTNIKEKTFVLVEVLEFKLLEESETLTFHLKNMTIVNADLRIGNDPEAPNIDFEIDEEKEIATYDNLEVFPIDTNIRILLWLEGKINEDISEGLYLKRYRDGDTER